MASQHANMTLRHLLCQEKPTIRRETRLTKNTTGEWPRVKDITVWHDFTLESLNEAYGHVLDTDVSQLGLATPQPKELEGLVTERDKDIGHLIGWNDEMLQQTARYAKRQLEFCQSSNLTFSYSTPDDSFIARLPTVSTPILVDHVIGIDDPFQPVLVVGFGRTSKKWSCTKLLTQLQRPSQQLSWPIRQLANICQNAGTRYGYIQTEDELVACCFSIADGCSFKAEIMPIPWTKHGIHTLTTDLALWWLCMLAMAPDQSRKIVRERDVVRINQWREVQGWQGTLYRHQYSNFEKPKGTPDPPLSPRTFNALLEDVASCANLGPDFNGLGSSGFGHPGQQSEQPDWSNLASISELTHLDFVNDHVAK
ncbi:hypothetical protein VCV18_011044 [Metarhizium anisopliae]